MCFRKLVAQRNQSIVSTAKTNEGSQARPSEPYLVLRDVVTYSRNPRYLSHISALTSITVTVERSPLVISQVSHAACERFLIFLTVLSTRGQ